jgi:curved DNA-binding protein CbpA
MLKKPSLLSTCCGLQNHLYPQHGASTSPSSPPQQRARSSLDFRCKRSYANVHHPRGPDFRDNMNWPTKTSSLVTPTPYEIFDLDKGAAYSKHKFYELVKIYHPDRHFLEESPCSRELSHGERLERYRLVILAHEILSDPTKRREYDNYGAGWADYQRTSNRHTRGYYAEGSRKPYGRGEGYDNSPFANATWEDWERWYERDANETAKQSYAGNYISPNMFASLILLMAVTSGVAQATRAGQFSGSLEERAQAFTEETGRFLTERAEKQKMDMLDSEGRIKWFLEKRDPSKYGLKDHEEGIYKGSFSPPMPPAPEKSEGSDTAD